MCRCYMCGVDWSAARGAACALVRIAPERLLKCLLRWFLHWLRTLMTEESTAYNMTPATRQGVGVSGWRGQCIPWLCPSSFSSACDVSNIFIFITNPEKKRHSQISFFFFLISSLSVFIELTWALQQFFLSLSHCCSMSMRSNTSRDSFLFLLNYFSDRTSFGGKTG